MLDLTVRELSAETIAPLVDYWSNSTPEYLDSLGADARKMPSPEAFTESLLTQLRTPYAEMKAYALIWYLDGQPIGHSNVNKIAYGEHAYMHLHIWYPEHRKKGYGTQFIKLGIPYFFKNLELKKLYCEPYSKNDAPNKTLIKAGFNYLRKYKCVPGYLNYEQVVHLYEVNRDEIDL